MVVEICGMDNCQNTDIELTWLGEPICSTCWRSVCEMEQEGEKEMESTATKKVVKKKVVKKSAKKTAPKAKATKKAVKKGTTPKAVKRVKNAADKWKVGAKTKAGAKILAVHDPDPRDGTPGHGRQITIACVITGKPRKIYVQDAHQVCTIDDPKVKAEMRKKRKASKG